MVRVNKTKISQEASFALSGAEYVRQQLSALTMIGTSPLANTVYALKLRVKTIDSLVGKTIVRLKKKIPYSPQQATDLVGMRLLALYATDLPELTNATINFIRFCQSSDIALIKGNSLDDAITEIKIYKSNQTERIYDNVFNYIQGLPLSKFTTEGKVKVEVITNEESRKSYSSIHIICNCLSREAGIVKTIPLEIQIRTIFEDAWGEIDHQLEYKFQQKVGKKKIPQKIVRDRDQLRSTLESVKALLEQAGSIAENVKLGYEQLFEALGVSTKNATNAFFLHEIYHTYPYEHTFSASLTAEDRERLENLLSEASKLRETVQNKKIINTQYRRILDSIDIFVKKMSIWYRQLDVAEEYNDQLRYFLNMEIAIFLTWQGLIKYHFDPQSVISNLSYLEKARDYYLSLEKEHNFREDCFLNFRLASVLYIIGEEDIAEVFLAQSLSSFVKNPEKVWGSFRFSIPHIYSFELWKKRTRILEMGFKNNNPRINREDQLKIVADAFFYAVLAFGELVNITELLEANKQELLLKSSNNVISLLWEFRDLCRSHQEYEFQLNKVTERLNFIGKNLNIDLDSMAKSIEENGAQLGHEARFHDTMMKFFHLKGDVDKLHFHRDQLSDRVKSVDSKYSEGDIDELFQYTLQRTENREKRYKLALPLGAQNN